MHENPNFTTEPTGSVNSEGKTIAIISYITIIGLIVAFVMNANKKIPFASYHIRQSLGIGLLGLALSVVGVIPVLGWIINIIGFFVLIYLWIMGLINAINERRRPVPWFGEKFEEWFKGI